MSFVIRDRNSNHILASGTEENETVYNLEGCWYFLPENVDMTHLVVTERTYTCPYKGICYWIDLESPETQARNIGFVYHFPKMGYEAIQNRIAFYSRETSGTISTVEETVTA